MCVNTKSSEVIYILKESPIIVREWSFSGQFELMGVSQGSVCKVDYVCVFDIGKDKTYLVLGVQARGP